MNEMDKKFPSPDDGCSYYTFEKYERFGNLFSPIEFNPAYIQRKHMDIPYGILPEQTLDLYLPDSGDGPWPVIFYIHGGGWMFGTKTLGAITCIIRALQYGYAIISPNYRLAPSVTFPAFIYDVKTAVRWARAHAGQYNLDPNRFGMVGDSAGGHITLMLGYTAHHPEYEGEQYGWGGFSSAVQAICDLYGPSDLSADQRNWYRASKVKRFPYPGKDPGYEPMFGTNNVDLLKLISPISFVTKDIPPTMIMHGFLDGIVAYQHSEILAEKISRTCGDDRVDYRLYPDRNHSDKKFLTEQSNLEIVAFFDQALKHNRA